MTELKYDQNKLEDFCRKYSLRLLVLHGSYAKNLAGEKSDIDVGILGYSSQIVKERYLDIMDDLVSVFGDKVDPVFLNNAESMITYHVAVNGKPLYEENPGIFNNFRAGAISRYIDTKKFRLLEAQYVRRAAGGSHG